MAAQGLVLNFQEWKNPLEQSSRTNWSLQIVQTCAEQHPQKSKDAWNWFEGWKQTFLLNFAGMNILICTPGRLLQHMDETPNFDASNIHTLVLDEADRILDMVIILSTPHPSPFC